MWYKLNQLLEIPFKKKKEITRNKTLEPKVSFVFFFYYKFLVSYSIYTCIIFISLYHVYIVKVDSPPIISNKLFSKNF